MKSKILFSLILSVVLFSCKKNVCPPDKKLGKISLRNETLIFNPYNGDEKLIFKNSQGDSLTLLAPEGKKITFDQLCVKNICTEPKIKGNSTCEYFDAETHRLIFRDSDQTTLVDILFYTKVYQENSQDFYSLIRVGLSNGNFISQASKITDIQFSGNFIESETGINSFFLEKNSIDLNSKIYSNIMAAETDETKIYYSKEQGLIGFQTPNTTWNLDRIE